MEHVLVAFDYFVDDIEEFILMDCVETTFDIHSGKIERPTTRQIYRVGNGGYNDHPLLRRMCWKSFSLVYISAELNKAFPT